MVGAARPQGKGLIFTAYAAGTGPAYGGELTGTDRAALSASVDAFDALLEATAPDDCEIECDTDFGKMRYGVRSQRWYAAAGE